MMRPFRHTGFPNHSFGVTGKTMHIQDGVLPVQTWVGGWILAGGWIGLTVRRLSPDDMPRLAVMSSAFFVASLIHVKIPGSSVHLLLHGLVGIILAGQAPLAIALGLLFQFLLFGHGGLTSMGVNTVLMGFPAALAGWVYIRFLAQVSVFWKTLGSALLTAAAVALSAFLAALVLQTAGEEFKSVAWTLFLGHIPIMFIEAVVTGFVVSFLIRVKPEMLSGTGGPARRGLSVSREKEDAS